MDMIKIILLLIVAVCGIALIYIARKKKALNKPDVIKPTDSSSLSGTTSGSTANTTGKTEEEKPSGPPQNTIYAFNAKSAKRLCPSCDGENNAWDKVCKICGQDL